jgi:hypothetical protein
MLAGVSIPLLGPGSEVLGPFAAPQRRIEPLSVES